MHEKVDIFLGNHTPQNDTAGKRKRMLAGEKDAFIDPTEWKNFHESMLCKYQTMLDEEARGTDMIE